MWSTDLNGRLPFINTGFVDLNLLPFSPMQLVFRADFCNNLPAKSDHAYSIFAQIFCPQLPHPNEGPFTATGWRCLNWVVQEKAWPTVSSSAVAAFLAKQWESSVVSVNGQLLFPFRLIVPWLYAGCQLVVGLLEMSVGAGVPKTPAN